MKGAENIRENSSVPGRRGLSIFHVFHTLFLFAETVVLQQSEKNRGLELCLSLTLSQIINCLRAIAISYHQSHIFITQPRMLHRGVTESVSVCIERAHVNPQRTRKGFPANSEDTAAAAARSLQSCPTLCDPADGSPPGSPVPGILQARTLEWAAISFSSAGKWKVKVKLVSRVPLFATPWTAARQAPPSTGFSRQQDWSGVPLPSPRRHRVAG